MKSFEEMYSELTQNFKEVENKRKKNNRFIIYIIVGFIVFITVTGICVKSGIEIGEKERNLILLIILLIILFIPKIINYIFLSKKNEDNAKSYLELYKEKIVEPIIKNIFPECAYYPFKGLPAEEYDKMLHYEGENQYIADDLIEGDIINKNGVRMHIKFSDLSVKKGREEELTAFYFQGMIGNITVDKVVSTYIKITTNNSIDKKKQILMDSNEFEKYFNVESPDKIMAMQILTSDVMLHMIDIWNKTNIKFEIVIKNNEINLCFFTGTMFATKVFGNSLGKERLKTYHYILEFVKNISVEISNAIGESDI